jgi:hypothetical protein
MIFVECDSDEVLVKTLGVAVEEISHKGSKGGKPQVYNKLNEDRNAKGMVDADPGCSPPPYDKEFERIEISEDVELKVDRNRNNHLIVLHPKLEDWIISSAKKAQVRMKDYGLPNDSEGLQDVINFRLDKFAKLVKKLKSKSSRVKQLKKLLLRD